VPSQASWFFWSSLWEACSGGVIGLLVAVPAAAVARSAFLQLRASGYAEEIAAQACRIGDDLLRGD
jgi:hypothetical protein